MSVLRLVVCVIVLMVAWPAAAYTESKVTASDTALGDVYGSSVAIDGDWAVVGATHTGVSTTYMSDQYGQAYVYHYDSTTYTWSEFAILTSSTATYGDSFGATVAISRDTIIVGAPLRDTAGSNSGSVFVFKYFSAVNRWVEVQELTGSDIGSNDEFGSAVAIDGLRLVIGADHQTFDSRSEGAVYVFNYSTTSYTWAESSKLTASDYHYDDYFGHSVDIAGNNIIVGSYYDDDMGNGSGAAYVYQLSPKSTSYAEIKITPSDGAAGDLFGYAVAINRRGEAVIGAYLDDDLGSQAGSAYVYYVGARSANLVVKLTASDGVTYDSFGKQVDISNDGTVAVAAAAKDCADASADCGAVYVFDKTTILGTKLSTWSQTDILRASDEDTSNSFGNDVALDDNRIIVGASSDDTGIGSLGGSAYLYE